VWVGEGGEMSMCVYVCAYVGVGVWLVKRGKVLAFGIRPTDRKID
jgi:hypothetical protein